MTDEQKENFSHNLKICRFIQQISANDLARKAGIGPMSRISLFEEKRGKPSLDEYTKICEALGQSMNDMIHRKAKITIEFETNY